jgi:hypothetical protein
MLENNDGFRTDGFGDDIATALTTAGTNEEQAEGAKNKRSSKFS